MHDSPLGRPVVPDDVPGVSGSPNTTVPVELRTPRTLLRPWRNRDAEALRPILEANQAHIAPWIPARISMVVPVPELATRLAGFAADFAADREWRYGMFTPDEAEILGEVGLYPRSSTGRAPYAHADHAELGYWLRADATGKGLVTEAARALMGVAAALPRISHLEIRCDPRNTPSVDVARRLGFVLAESGSDSIFIVRTHAEIAEIQGAPRTGC